MSVHVHFRLSSANCALRKPSRALVVTVSPDFPIFVCVDFWSAATDDGCVRAKCKLNPFPTEMARCVSFGIVLVQRALGLLNPKTVEGKVVIGVGPRGFGKSTVGTWRELNPRILDLRCSSRNIPHSSLG